MSCPHNCENKNSYGYCYNTSCINPKFSNQNVIEECNSHTKPQITIDTDRMIVIDELQKCCKLLKDEFDDAWECNSSDETRTNLSRKITNNFPELIQSIQYVIDKLR